MCSLTPDQIRAIELIKFADNRHDVVRLIEDHGLTHDLIPTEWKRSPEVWEALVDHMSYATLIANLGRLTEVGVLGPQSLHTGLVAARIVDRARIAHAQVQPDDVRAALAAYQTSGGWTPVAGIVAALEQAIEHSLAG